MGIGQKYHEVGDDIGQEIRKDINIGNRDWNFQYSSILLPKDCLDLLAVQGTLKSFLQHHSSKASILPCSAFFTV